MFQLAGGLVLADILGTALFVLVLVVFFVWLSHRDKKGNEEYLRATRGKDGKSSEAKLFDGTISSVIIGIAKWGIFILALGVLGKIASDILGSVLDGLPPVVQTILLISPVAIAIIYLLIKYFVLNAKNVPWKELGICSILIIVIFAGVIIWAKISG